MNAPLPPALVLTAALALGACSDRDPDTLDEPGAGTDAFADVSGGDPTDEPDRGSIGEPAIDPTDPPEPSAEEADAGGDPVLDTPTDGDTPVATGRPGDVDDAPSDGDAMLGGDAPSTDGAVPDGGSPTVIDDEPRDGVPVDPPDGEDVFVPAIPGDPDAARVLDGTRLALGRTLLDLGARLAGGEPLDEQREDCLGAYDPALGETLTAIECARPLVTDPVAIFVERGAFYPTDACRAALAEARADACVLAYASVSAPVVFVQTPPARRPTPLPGSGVEVSYGLDGPVLSVTGDERALTGAFRCEIDLTTGARLPGAIGDCDALLRDVAAHFDTLLDEVR